jgi:DNA recombination protein RmuC
MEFQEKTTDRFDKEFKELTESINQKMLVINEKVEQKLSKGFEDANNTFVQIAKRVEVIDEAQKNIQELSKEMVSLQNILSNNQARGSYGEFQLNQLLRVVYGEYEHIYKTQYTLKEGKEVVRADAVVFLPEPNGMIAIDSKFPFSAFSQLFDNKDLTKDEETKLISQFSNEVKKHITDISNKYIIPTITTDYALMFVPSDGILALLHSKLRNVIDYSRERKVTIVSPTTIIPLLSSFKAFMIDYAKNKYTDQINEQLVKLSKDFKLFNQDWSKLTNSIESLKRNSDNINNRVEKITEKFGKIEKIGINQESSEELIEELED